MNGLAQARQYEDGPQVVRPTLTASLHNIDGVLDETIIRLKAMAELFYGKGEDNSKAMKTEGEPTITVLLDEIDSKCRMVNSAVERIFCELR